LKIIVSSENPVKVAATRDAFTSLFPNEPVELESVRVASDVSDQPASDEETRAGARNRVINARAARPAADFWTRLEGGIELIDEQLMAFAWMAVLGAEGTVSLARSVSLPLPPAVRQLIDQGLELGEANDRVFATLNSKQGGGAFGLLTDGRYTRESVYTQTMILALIPYANPLFPQSR
jgi:inosine/xanthosine triphosphatase